MDRQPWKRCRHRATGGCGGAASLTGVCNFAEQSTSGNCGSSEGDSVAWLDAGHRTVILAVLLAGGYFLDKTWRSKDETTPIAAVISDKSIAVLPFVDMSEKKDQEYFADGMAEEIIDLLVKIPGLKVISRTSSFQFKGKTEDLRQHRHAGWGGLCFGGKRT